MAAPTTDSPFPAPPAFDGPAPAAVGRWWIVSLFGAWSAFVWATRTVNVWRDLLLSTDEKVVLTVVAAIFVVLGVAALCIGVGLRKWAPTRVDVITVGVLGGWTCGVWLLR